MTRSGMASKQRAMTKASIATPQPTRHGRQAGATAGVHEQRGRDGDGTQRDRERADRPQRGEGQERAEDECAPPTPKRRAPGGRPRGAVPTDAPVSRARAERSPRATKGRPRERLRPRCRHPGARGRRGSPPPASPTRSATRRESAPALGPAAMVSARRGAAIRAAGRMIAKAARYRALSTSCSCSLRGGGSGVGLVRINAGPRTSTKSPIASATVSASVGPRGARGPMRCSDAAGA